MLRVVAAALLTALGPVGAGTLDVPKALEAALLPGVESLHANVTRAGCHNLAVLPLCCVTGDHPPAPDPLGRLLSMAVSALLARRAAGALTLADPETAARAAPAGTLDAAVAQALTAAVGPLDAVIAGTVESRADRLRLRLTLIGLANPAQPGAPTLVELPWDPDLLTLSGRGYAFEEKRGLKPSQVEVVPAALGALTPPDGRGPFRLELLFGDQLRRPEPHGTTAQVAVKPGETFQVRLSNDLPERVGVALLLDGLSSVGCKRQLPTQATKWILGPKASIIVAGWQVDEKTLREFKIERSAAGGPQAAASGWITASFFAEAATLVGDGPDEESRDLGPLVVGAGAEIPNRTRRTPFNAAPVPAATLALRYVGG